MLSPVSDARYDGPVPRHLQTRAAPPALYGPPPSLSVDLWDLFCAQRRLRRMGTMDESLGHRIAALHARLVRLKSWDVF
ncbi:hypothetical protein [Micavibrio aeruginosavorus]|uniref:hypothetical protein n=1 Tax=Micavibrio aeruginosavorus TaxID=349221 RepID=UPI000345CBEF|nr:hypothetical protein [Micavibrio aeruginosavorus]